MKTSKDGKKAAEIAIRKSRKRFGQTVHNESNAEVWVASGANV